MFGFASSYFDVGQLQKCLVSRSLCVIKFSGKYPEDGNQQNAVFSVAESHAEEATFSNTVN